MKSESWKNKIQEYIHEHKLRKRWLKITASLGALAIVMTAAAMILPAITMENTPQMLEGRIDIHTHTDSCYDAERNVICGFADFVVHTHNGAFPELLFYLRDSRVESFSFFFAYLIGHKVLLYKLSLRYCHVKNKAVFLAHCLTCSLPPSKT